MSFHHPNRIGEGDENKKPTKDESYLAGWPDTMIFLWADSAEPKEMKI